MRTKVTPIAAILLHATAHRVSAAFHAQPLELPRLRPEVRATITSGQVAQMPLRLGNATRTHPTPRRPALSVLSAE
ncbi:hypothetical protein [Streptomyces sp. NBC_00996]|uniref:hypothetical protein n=1 Tax=Streptomyces sp. NBC_00996 TaxID=2903710 RepID=UPI00386B9093|nr:hypothetical protein OG390_02300 [Streptomyces sp. NBC_00996]